MRDGTWIRGTCAGRDGEVVYSDVASSAVAAYGGKGHLPISLDYGNSHIRQLPACALVPCSDKRIIRFIVIFDIFKK